jgi:hypothetical protein
LNRIGRPGRHERRSAGFKIAHAPSAYLATPAPPRQSLSPVATPVDTQDSAYLLCHGLRACFCCIKRRFETEKRHLSQRLFHSKPLKSNAFPYYYYK